MWILKYNGNRPKNYPERPGIRFNDKQAMLEYIQRQHPAIRPLLVYEERRGIEPRKPTHPG